MPRRAAILHRFAKDISNPLVEPLCYCCCRPGPHGYMHARLTSTLHCKVYCRSGYSTTNAPKEVSWNGDETPVEQTKKHYISPPSATRIRLSDGQHLAYEEQGVLANRARFPLIAPHSFLSSRLTGIRGINTSLLEEFGAHLVTYDLPGFGESDPHHSRNLNYSALDMLHLPDALGTVDRFWFVGYSGGGMRAWSALRYIPDRVAVPRRTATDTEDNNIRCCKRIYSTRSRSRRPPLPGARSVGCRLASSLDGLLPRLRWRLGPTPAITLFPTPAVLSLGSASRSAAVAGMARPDAPLSHLY